MLKTNIIVLFILSTLLSPLMAQDKVISLEEAIATALANNYEVLIAKNKNKLSKLGFQRAINAFFPNLNVGLSYGYDKQSQAVFADQAKTVFLRNVNSAKSQFRGDLGISLGVNDIYNEILNIQQSVNSEEISEFDTKATLQSLIQQVISNYYNLAKQQQLLEIQKQAVETSLQQLKRAESRYEIGSVAKKDVLTAKVQLNNDKTNLLNQELQLLNARNSLNISLGLDPLNDLTAISKVNFGSSYTTYSELEKKVYQANPDLLSSLKQIKSSEYESDKAFNNFLPNANFSINWGKSISPDSNFSNITSNIIDFSKDYVFSTSLGFTMNINYGNFLQDEQAQINLQNSHYTYEKNKKDIQANAYRAFTTYQNAKQLLVVQEENLEATREDLRLAQERFNLGSGTSLELRQAQDGLTRAEAQLINAKFDAKLAEVELDKLTGVISVE